MTFSDIEYNTNAIFRYDNNFYAVIETLGPKVSAVLKNTEVAIVYPSLFSFSVDVNFLVEQELVAVLTNNFGVSDPFIAEIIQKQPLPPSTDLEPTWQIPRQSSLPLLLAQLRILAIHTCRSILQSSTPSE